MCWNRWLGIYLLIGSGVAWPQQIYKSTDQQGKVIYSDQLPADAKSVEPVKIKHGPTKAEVRDAKERVRALDKAAGEVSKSRADRQQSRSSDVANAKATLKEAERRLESAKQVGPGDRKGTAGGGNRLTESYWQRVRTAEAAVESARQKLKQAQTGKHRD